MRVRTSDTRQGWSVARLIEGLVVGDWDKKGEKMCTIVTLEPERFRAFTDYLNDCVQGSQVLNLTSGCVSYTFEYGTVLVADREQVVDLE